MAAKDFTTTILVDKNPQEAYDAINNVRGWWSENIEGSTDTLNSVFVYRYKDVHLCKIKVSELIPAQKVTWHVLENYFQFTEDKSEWKDTNIIFDIATKGNKTEITFTHQGLTPQYECYQVCFDAWTNYIQNSLYNLATTGKGNPTLKDSSTENFNEQLLEKWGLK